MLANYVITAIRSLLKNKTHTVINALGLAFGIACVFMITLYLQKELSYDRFHTQPENLYRVTWADANPQTRTPHPMAQALKTDFPEVESAVSLTPLYAAGLTRETHSFRNPKNDRRYDEKNILAVDTTFFDVFSFPLVKGNPKTALKSVNGVLISEAMAEKYFPGEDPLGQQLAVDEAGYLMEVVGVFRNVPEASHFHFDFLVSYLREKSFDPSDPFYSWQDFGHYNYIRLRDGADAKELEAKLMPWLRKYIEVPDEQYNHFIGQGYGFRLQPVTDIHLRSRLRWELEANGNIEYVYILAGAALLTLIIASVNFINLTTARSVERAKEIGVRKTLGAGQSQLSSQFLAESVMMSIVSMLVAMLIMEVTLPVFNTFTGLGFQIDYTRDGMILLVLALVLGVLSGVYPAAYLSRIKAHMTLKGRTFQSPGGATFRRGLIVFQFFMSMLLLSSAIVIYTQLDYLSSKELGFQKEAVVVIPVKNESGLERFEALQNELSKIDGVVSVSASSNIPGGQFNQHHIASIQYPDDDIPTSEVLVDYDFFRTLSLSVVEGRTFTREIASDSGRVFVINEAAARELNLKGSVVGEEIWWKHREQSRQERGRVIGVVKDFHFQSLHEPIRPLIFTLTSQAFNHILVRMDTRNVSERMSEIEKIYKTFEPVYGFEFSFLEEQLNAQYASETRTMAILTIFTFVAILIACFGLFAMSLLTFQQKIKELSVRKLLGASVGSILLLLVGDFTRLIALAVILAIPLAWWLMTEWLQNFSYQVAIHPFIFVGSGLLLVAIAWMTLSYFSVKASRLNPADTLKNE